MKVCGSFRASRSMEAGTFPEKGRFSRKMVPIGQYKCQKSRIFGKSAGVACPVVVVGNQSRYKSRPRDAKDGVCLRALTTCCCPACLRISYVPTRPEQIANANLSMSHKLLQAYAETNIAFFLM